MRFVTKMNLKVYILLGVLAVFTAFAWFGIAFMNANEILNEDGIPFSSKEKLLFSTVLSIIVLSWSMSLLTLLTMVVRGYAFYMDETGIHSTVSISIVFAFVFVIPIREIPYSAIRSTTVTDGALVLQLDKSKIHIAPPLRLFARKEYRFLAGLTKVSQEELKLRLDSFCHTKFPEVGAPQAS